MKTKAQKQKDLEALTEQFKNAKAAMLVGFQKMTVAKDQELRNQLREAGVSYEVVKNTLARKAIAGTQFEVVGKSLKGPLVLAFSKEDPGAAARLVKDFAKANDKLVTTVVSLGGIRDVSALQQIARDLPQLDRQPPHRARVRDDVAHALRHAKAVGRRRQIQSRLFAEVLHREAGVIVAGVEAGTDRGSADRQLLDARRKILGQLQISFCDPGRVVCAGFAELCDVGVAHYRIDLVGLTGQKRGRCIPGENILILRIFPGRSRQITPAAAHPGKLLRSI